MSLLFGCCATAHAATIGDPDNVLAVPEPAPPFVEQYLLKGTISKGEEATAAQLKKNSTNDELRFGLGILQVLRSVERMARDLHRFGLRDLTYRQIPFLRIPVPDNPHPQELSYVQLRKIAETFRANLERAEQTLSGITDENVKVPLHFGMIKMDLNGDYRAEVDETLWKIYARLQRNEHITPRQSQSFCITFDRADVHWLRGYCHLLMGVCDFYLAHDSKETFDCTAHIFFKRVDSPYSYLKKGKRIYNLRDSDTDIADLVALIHTIRWPVVEPKRMASALTHFETVVSQSREQWKYILAETDDDFEWIPNPKQTGVIPNTRVTENMVTAWTEIVNQIDQVLQGKLLISFWRAEQGRGVNLRKAFLQPSTFDLVLWVQGSAARPYLETGNTTKAQRWRELMGAFGNFPGTAMWFN